jgi:hypothetical protein
MQFSYRKWRNKIHLVLNDIEVSPDPLGLSADALGFLKFISLLLRLS